MKRGVDTPHDPIYGTLEANVGCGGSKGGYDKKRKKMRSEKRSGDSSKRKAYDRMDESIGMREYEMRRKK